MQRVRRVFRKKPRAKGHALTTEMKSEVRKIIARPVELKQSLTVLNSVSIRDMANVGGRTMVAFTSGITQGNGDTNSRTGDQISLKSLECRVQYQMDFTNQGPANATPCIRTVVLQWHPQLDATYANLLTNLPAAQLFETGPTGVIDPCSVYDWDYRQSFTILYDKTHEMTLPSNSATSLAPYYNTGGTHYVHFNVPLAKARKRVQYVGASAVVASNHLIFLCWQFNSSASAPPILFMGSRLVYSDD